MGYMIVERKRQLKAVLPTRQRYRPGAGPLLELPGITGRTDFFACRKCRAVHKDVDVPEAGCIIARPHHYDTLH